MTRGATPGRAAFGKRLRLLLWAHDLPASVLASEIGVSKASVSHYLAGRESPSPQRCAAIAGFFGVDAAWLATGEGSPGKDLPAPLEIGEC